MPPPDEGTAGFDGPTEPTDETSSTSAIGRDHPDRDSSSGIFTERLITDLRLDASRRPGALGRLGHYEILSVVGAGAMGVVLKAFDDELYRTVAIKVLSSHLMASEQARQRFKREARSAASLNQPNVVTIHEIEEHNEVPYLVMEFIDGMSLQQRIARGTPMLTIDILRISQQITIGLSAAHRNGVVHRDIKPANIMLEDGIERVKITDFGLAKAAMGNSDLTSFGKMIGTPSYMSPEQVSGDPLDGRSDLYSLGCVMYSMVAGSPPFRGENCLAVAHRIRTESPRSLREKNPDVPRFLEEIILRLLEKDPDKRFQSADELAAVLTQRLAKVNLGGSSFVFSDAGTTKVLKGAKEINPRATPNRFKIGALIACFAVLLGSLWMLRPEPPPASALPLPPPPPEALRPTITVSRDDADAATITKALEMVREPWTVIKVLDDGLYRERISIVGPRHHGLKLIAERGAALEHTPDQPPADIFSTEALIDVDSVSDVTIEGFRLQPVTAQWGIRIRGKCPGLDISRIQSTHPERAERVFLYAHQGASGTAEKPIRLHDLVLSCAGAFYFTANIELAGREGSGNPIENIDIENNVISGSAESDLVSFTEVPGRGLPSHIRINVRRNLFIGGKAGVMLLAEQPDVYESVIISQNTFANLRTLIFTMGDQAQNSDVLFDSNLVLGTSQVIVGTGVARKTWFQNMHWELSPGCNQSAIEEIATPHPLILMESREFGAPGFMHPQAGALPELEGPFPGAFDRTEPQSSEESPEVNSSP